MPVCLERQARHMIVLYRNYRDHIVYEKKKSYSLFSMCDSAAVLCIFAPFPIQYNTIQYNSSLLISGQYMT